MTFNELRAQVLRKLGDAEVTSTDNTYTVVGDFLNAAHKSRCVESDWSFMLWPIFDTFTTVASQRNYALNAEFQRPLYFWNRNTKQYLTEIPFRDFESQGVDWINDSGDASRFYLGARTPLSVQPSSDSAITIVSSSASDTTPTVIVRGMTANGVTTETLTANGITGVTGTTTFKANGILNITKTGTWVGSLTVKAGTTTLLTLFPTENGRSYIQLELLNLPPASQVVEYRFYRNPSPLTNDGDIPDIPAPFDEVLIYDALLLFAGYNSEINAMSVTMWGAQQKKLEMALETAFLNPQTIGSGVRFVRNLSDGAIPRVRQS